MTARIRCRRQSRPNRSVPRIGATLTTTIRSEWPAVLPDRPSRSNRTRVRDTLDPADPKVNDQADRPAEQEPRPIPEEILPRGRANPPESYEPTIVIDGSGDG